ncbi:MAG: MBL fold metallo-hydrolase [Bacilli bacterium]|nr:MBL fold metallo-hydrolase [Bacilli bacterium]
MKVKSIKVGFLECNCYLLEKDNKYLLIDPGDDLEKIEEFIKDKQIVGILITHSHFDHIASAYDLEEKYNYIIYDLNNLKEGMNNIDVFKFNVIKTFGHTMDSISFYFKDEKIMFTGDFLFYHTIGRCDLPESNYQEMLESIKKIKKYPEDCTIYPGHGKKSSLKEEFKRNIYLNNSY